MPHISKQTRIREPYRPADYVCQLHPRAAVEYDPEEEIWRCTICGLDIQDTFAVALP